MHPDITHAPAKALRTRRPRASSLLRGLGIVGWDALEPVVLAALATEAPLLVIGPHGSAKTLLLDRIARALALQHRHYNASLLNFDDLVGFPVPEAGRLVYLQTPSTIWDAESVFFDEVSRCRPDLQNKLFPIVHERVVQGLPLGNLRFRWAAMNPPPSEDSKSSPELPEYAGAEPLDVALADRFAFVISAPALADLDPRDQLTVLRDQARCEEDGASKLAAAVERARSRIAAVEAGLRDAAAEYTQLLTGELAKAGHPVSTRRAVQIARNIVALEAAMEADGPPPSVEDAFFVAVQASLPDAAWGRPVPAAKVLGAHKAAWEIARLTADAPMRRVLIEADPLKRLALVIDSTLGPVEAGQVIADSFAARPASSQMVTSAFLMPLVSRRTDLPAGTIEPIAAAHAQLVRRDPARLEVRPMEWRKKVATEDLPKLDTRSKRGRVLANAAVALLVANQPFDVDSLAAAYDAADRVLGPLVEARRRSARRRPQ